MSKGSYAVGRGGDWGDWFSLCGEVFHLPPACSGHLLPNAWHDVNRKMKTSYWHPASASPSSSASCLPPLTSHFLSPFILSSCLLPFLCYSLLVYCYPFPQVHTLIANLQCSVSWDFLHNYHSQLSTFQPQFAHFNGWKDVKVSAWFAFSWVSSSLQVIGNDMEFGIFLNDRICEFITYMLCNIHVCWCLGPNWKYG